MDINKTIVTNYFYPRVKDHNEIVYRYVNCYLSHIKNNLGPLFVMELFVQFVTVYHETTCHTASLRRNLAQLFVALTHDYCAAETEL